MYGSKDSGTLKMDFLNNLKNFSLSILNRHQKQDIKVWTPSQIGMDNMGRALDIVRYCMSREGIAFGPVL